MIPIEKVKSIVDKYKALEKELASGDISKKDFVKKSKEYSSIGEVINEARGYIGFEKEKNELEKIINEKDSDKELRFTHLTMALKESEEFIYQLENRLTELCRVADTLEIGNPDIIRKWLSDDCKPCLVEHIIEGYEEVYEIMIEMDNRLMWPGWPLIGKLHDPIE